MTITNISKQTTDNPPRWLAVGDAELALWDDGLAGLLLLGDIDSERLRGLSARALTLANPDMYPSWIAGPLPDAEVVSDAWRNYLSNQIGVHRFAPKGDDEKTDDFYERVARAYRSAGTTPTTELATAAGVKRATAARWVHQARLRGYLPATDPGKATR